MSARMRSCCALKISPPRRDEVPRQDVPYLATEGTILSLGDPFESMAILLGQSNERRSHELRFRAFSRGAGLSSHLHPREFQASK